MKKIKIKAPAKINLDLKIRGIRSDGFHEIESRMQTISLFDFLTIEVDNSLKSQINLNGTRKDALSYDNKNIAYKSAELFFKKTGIGDCVKIFIEKNIPISAGLAGGSADGAGVLYGLNKIFNEPINDNEILKLCSLLGSDLNFCYIGGCAKVTGRGEIVKPIEFNDFNLTIVKPKNLGISAKEAYLEFDRKNEASDMANDLEFALLGKYPEIDYLHSLGLIMSGSGSAFYKIGDELPKFDDEKYEIIKDLKAIPYGVREV